MRKYFYTNGIDKIGPFSLEEMEEQNLTRDTKVWFYGLDNWMPLKEIEELKSLTNSIPPPLKSLDTRKIVCSPIKGNAIVEEKRTKKKPENRKTKKVIVTVFVAIAAFTFVGYFLIKNQAANKLHTSIASSAYESNVDFNFYVDKFYRDIGNYGIFPKKPEIQIIKFAKLDQLDNTTHIHGISFGIKDDDKIEIYINPTTWDKFNKPMRYFLMYHELSHDVLNVGDLKDLPINEGKLMYPAIANYESKTMDDFIESSHTLFEEVAAKQLNY